MPKVKAHMRKGRPVREHFRKGSLVVYKKSGRMKGALGTVLGESHGKVIPVDFSGYATFVNKGNLKSIK